VSRFVIDASVAVKWVVSEPDSDDAEALLDSHSFVAPDLIVAECANILWKKVRRGQLSVDDAIGAAQTLQSADIELRPMNSLIVAAIRMAVTLGHPAYDCFYLALAREQTCPFVTADVALVRKVASSETASSITVLALREAAKPPLPR